VSSRLAITQNFEAPLTGPAPAQANSKGTVSDFASLIHQLTSESPTQPPAHQPTWGQGFGNARGAGDLVAGVPAAATKPQPATELTGELPEPMPQKSTAEPITEQPLSSVTDEEATLPEIKSEPVEHHIPITAPRQQQKSTPAKTKENAQTAPVVIPPQTPAPVPIILKLPTLMARPSTSGSAEHTEDSRPAETTSRRTARAENAETLELRPPAALEVTLRSKEQPAQPSVDVASQAQTTPHPPVRPAPEKTEAPQSTPAPEKQDAPQSTATPQDAHVAPTQPAPPVQHTTPVPVPAPAPVTQPHPAMVAPASQAHYAQTTHTAPKSDTPPPSSVSHLDEMPEEPKQQTQALRSLSLEFTPDGAQDVRLRLAERAGDVHISLHSTDPALSGRLSDGVHDLVGNLSSAGYDAHAWTPEQGRQNNQRQFEDQRRGRRNPSPEQGAEEFGGLMQQPIQEVS
jgi:hypothetical protein